jgi:endoglucanase
MNGVNLTGMEGGYGGGVAGSAWNRRTGPVPGTDYAVHDTRLIDYFVSKRVHVVRLLFSWERVQSSLGGPMPAAGAGYAAYVADLARIVRYATRRRVTVILEPWQANASGGVGGPRWRGQLVGSKRVPVAAFLDLWSRLATIFAANHRVQYGLVNEPNGMSTMAWFRIAQQCIDAIRAAGATTRILVPGNGYTGAGSWTDDWYDTARTRRSNAYGWRNANGRGAPLRDPLGKLAAEVHLYLDPDASGSTTDIASATIASERLAVAATEAASQGYPLFVGEIGFWAGHPLAADAWADFTAFVHAHRRTVTGFAWWAAGSPGWWDDVAADGGGHFSVTPTDGTTFTGDTINIRLIEQSL